MRTRPACAQIVGDGIATGEFALVDPAIATTFILGALNDIATWFRPDGRLSPDQLADAAMSTWHSDRSVPIPPRVVPRGVPRRTRP